MTKVSSKHTLSLQAPIDRWDEALPLGNGLLGALLWGNSTTIKLSLDRGDLWDLRMPEAYKRKDFTWDTLKRLAREKNVEQIREIFDKPYTDCPYPTKIPAGRIELDMPKGTEVQSFSLDLRCALGMVECSKGTIEAFLCAASPVGFVRLKGITAKARICPVPFGEKVTDDTTELGSGGNVARLGYPRPKTGSCGVVQWVVQECAEGLTYAIVLGQRKFKNGDYEIAFTIACSNDGDDPLAIGRSRIDAALQEGFTRALATHIPWWKQFWKKSSISIPQAALEQHYYLVHYYYGAASRLGMPALPLQGVWTADEGTLPPWKGDYHHDLNTQVSYWAYHTANHLDEGRCFLDFLWDRFDSAKKFARDFYGTEGACVPGVMTLDGQPLAGWPQYSVSPTNSAWLAHNFYLHWRYTMDRGFLLERAYPYCKAVAVCLRALLQPDSRGMLKLPLSSSPEVHDDQLNAWLTPNSNYDLALLRWLFAAVGEMASELGYDSDVTWCRDTLNKLDDLAVEEKSFDGSSSPGSLKISPDESLAFSHRHFSHLMAMYPLGTLHTEGSKRDRTVIDASFRHIDMLGYGLWVGYSFSWMACMAARCGKPQRALMMLELFLKGFISRNGFHLNGDYKQLGLSSWNYRPFTLEGNFAAAQAVHEMLLQSWNGTIRIFPAIPADWHDAAFENLRAEGAFLVWAKRENGHTVWLKIVAERGGTVRLRNPFGSSKVKWNSRDIRRNDDDYVCVLKANEYLEGWSEGA